MLAKRTQRQSKRNYVIRRYRADDGTGFVLLIDDKALAGLMAARARHNKSRKAATLGGIVVCHCVGIEE